MPRRRLAGTTLAVLALGGCGTGVLTPAGAIGAAQKTMMLNSLGIMLAIVVPTIGAVLVTAWWFRESNTRARYRPEWTFSGQLELVVWAIPAMTVLLLAGIAWIGSHELDPAKPVTTGRPPLDVQVVSMDWKWLFIYPGQNVATVNRLVVPTGTPIRFRLTSSSVWNSFFVPQLGSQIYTMAGMTTRLTLVADKPGRYPGLSAHYSGRGFSEMKFVTDAVPPADFARWAAGVRGRGPALDARTYALLARPAPQPQPLSFGAVAPGLFDAVVMMTAPMPHASTHGQARTER